MIVTDEHGNDVDLHDPDDDHPAEEPPGPEPLDLDEVEQLLERAVHAEVVDEQREAERRLYDAVPELLARLRSAEGALVRYRALPMGFEYAVTDGEPPTADTPRVTLQEAYAELEKSGGRVPWTQVRRTYPWGRLECPPF